MSAKPIQLLLLVAWAQFASVCVVQESIAAPAASGAEGAREAAPEPRLESKEDVELVLREAQSAIKAGKFERAHELITRAENAHVRYSLFHFGPTPSSVRRELNRARRDPSSVKAAEPVASGTPVLTTGGRNSGPSTLDPFMAGASSAEPKLPRGPLAEPAAPSMSHRDINDVEAQADSEPDALPGLKSVSNPFAGSASGVQPAQFQLTPEGESASLAGGSDLRIGSAGSGESEQPGASDLKQQVLSKLAEARQALDAGDLEKAEVLSREASALGVPESQFLPNEDRPSLLAWDLVRASQSREAAPATRLPALDVAPAADVELTLPAESEQVEARQERAARAEVVAQAKADEPMPLALPNGDLGGAIQPERIAKSGGSLIDSADAGAQVLARQLSAEIGKRQSEAQKLRSEDPERAIAILHEAQQLVKDSKLPESSQRELLSRIEITLEKTNAYVKQHGAQIELDRQNAKVLADLDRDRELKLKIEQKIADMVEEFNRLRDEQRYAEAEIVARRLIELAPENPVAQQVYQTAKFIRREMMNRDLAHAREEGNWEALNDVERSTVSNVGDGRELVFDQKHWEGFVKKRTGSRDRIQRRTERELEIERRLKTPVMLRYEDTPLREVMDGLSQLTGVNIHLDPRGLSQEGYDGDTKVTLNLNKEISLQSALNLILEPLHLSYVITDDVLKVTSEQLRDGEIYPVTYNVSDLVIPIPNFVPSSNIGLQGLINDAHAAAGFGRNSLVGGGPSVLVNSHPQHAPGVAGNDQVLAQQFNAGAASSLSPTTVPIGAGPGGMGAGANADFDSLIDLIVSTVATETWAENGGGEAEVRPFPTNLSLVISQTQAVHEEIADLLEQLRRLQDLQVTIEVRFIRLNDSFFERIGIDFDMNVEDRTGETGLVPGSTFEPAGRRSNTVGLLPPAGNNVFPNFTTDLDIPFRQDSFNLTQLVPFGGPVGGGLNFGFAILSDIEAYFLIEAAQGDSRTNVLNAPKVTLFNGQQAFVADATQRPFVVGVIPVVGEFAAAQQPVIVVLNEGTMMTIQAVVSDDRRYVRMTIVPFFTQIGDVDTFTFEGSSSSSSSSSSTDDDDDGKKSQEESEEEVRSGVTVQLPSFSFVSVVTTVSVPDGGTVLLGGIKRLNEGRNEFGVPLLSKVPYINRLFRNVSIGRETESLMMMVTPRIIIQEEEEERLGIAVP